MNTASPVAAGSRRGVAAQAPGRAARAAAAGVLAAALAPAACADEGATAAVTGAVGLASAQVLRGVSLSNGSASLSLDLNRRFAGGWAVGASLATLGRDALGTRGLLGLSASRSWQVDADWTAQAGLAHYAYPGGGERHRYDYDELLVSVGWRGLWSASLAVLPGATRRGDAGELRRGRAHALELGLHQPLGGGLAVDAGLGWMDLRRVRGSGYAYGSVGLSWGQGPWQLFATRIVSQASARGLAAPGAGDDRWVGALLWNF